MFWGLVRDVFGAVAVGHLRQAGRVQQQAMQHGPPITMVWHWGRCYRLHRGLGLLQQRQRAQPFKTRL